MPLIRLTANIDGADLWIHSAHIVAITQEVSMDKSKKLTRVVTTNGIFAVREEPEYIANKPAMQYTGKK